MFHARTQNIPSLGVLKTFLIFNTFHIGPYGPPRETIGPNGKQVDPRGPIASQRGLYQYF